MALLVPAALRDFAHVLRGALILQPFLGVALSILPGSLLGFLALARFRALVAPELLAVLDLRVLASGWARLAIEVRSIALLVLGWDRRTLVVLVGGASHLLLGLLLQLFNVR